MALALYMDHHVPRAITLGLYLRAVDVITAHEDGASQMSDPDLLDRARSLNRVLFTQDDDLLAEASARQGQGIPFFGVIYAPYPAKTLSRGFPIARLYDEIALNPA